MMDKDDDIKHVRELLNAYGGTAFGRSASAFLRGFGSR